MTGVAITHSFEVGRIMGAIDGIAAIAANPASFFRAVGPGLVATTHDRFDAAREPYGAPWKALLPAYAAIKKGLGILRESGMRGGLMGSITFQVSGSELLIGSNKVYAAVHQFGGVIKAKTPFGLCFKLAGDPGPKGAKAKTKLIHVMSVRIPQRPYLGFGPADYRVVMDALEWRLGQVMH